MATQTNNYGLTKPAWDELVDVSVLNDNSDIIDAQMHANELNATQAVANMADAYDATATYHTGDYCTYGGRLYQANTDISTAEAFDATHWDETTAAEHFSDGGGGGGGTLIQPVIYSDTEREIGVWRDGKPLYQITYTTTISSNVSSTRIDITTLNVDTVVDMYGTLNGQVAIKPIPNVDDSSTGNNYALDVIDNKTTLRLTKGSGYFTEGTLYITLRYTKTTDTAGSGTWTPSGVPAVHYSTDEQVVGTWIDGRPVYEVTLTVATTTQLNNVSWTAIPFLETEPTGVDFIIDAVTTTNPPTNSQFRFKYENGHFCGASIDIDSVGQGSYCIFRYVKTTP